jgi:hypothetical protein
LLCRLLADKFRCDTVLVANLNSLWRQNSVKLASFCCTSPWLTGGSTHITFLRASRLCLLLNLFDLGLSGSFFGLSSHLCDGLRSHEIFFKNWNTDARSQENGLIGKHESKLLVTDGSASAHD